MTSDAEPLARRLLEVWNARDLDAFMAMLSEDIRWYDCGMPNPPAIGHAAVRAFAETVLQAFPDFAYEIREPVCTSDDGARVVFAWQITATASGWFKPPGFAPTGRRVSFPGVDVLDVRNDKIVNIETYFDAIAAAEQVAGMRLRPRPGSLREKFLVILQRIGAAWTRQS